jgi:hypothetical protein
MTKLPRLVIEPDPHQPGSRHVLVRQLGARLAAALYGASDPERLLQSMLRVRVLGATTPGIDSGDLPDVAGRYEVLADGIRFIPRFPFEPGVRFRATLSPSECGSTELPEGLAHEFSIPTQAAPPRARVTRIFPSSDELPENLLRFYLCFSGPMQRGCAQEHVILLDADGRPAPDVLYRPPVELWDGSMRHLTILLDPGRLKRGVGPNKALGPPLKAGLRYTVAVGSGMLDSSGRPLRASFSKPFRVTEAVREAIAVEGWQVFSPKPESREPLELLFPRALDWALLWHCVNVITEADESIQGGIAIDQGERRWRFTPNSAWISGRYRIRVKSGLEDVCGNDLQGAFDRRLSPTRRLDSNEAASDLSFFIG